jgi:glycosyltransferase involved in cell wall biosynthesis
MSRLLEKFRSMSRRVQEVEPNLFVLNPTAVPLYGRAGQRINRFLLRMQVRDAMRRLGFSRPINWVFNPAAAVVAGELGEDLLIYYCVDEYAAFSGVPARSIAEMEGRLLRDADLVVVSADNLLRSKRQANGSTILLRHGVDYEHFRQALDVRTQVPIELSKLPKPIIGYFGLMSQDWFDAELMIRVARKFQNCSVVLLGKCSMDLSRLTCLPNVHLLGRKPYAALPAYSRGFDVAVIPFPINEVTVNANPLKAREYLAAGLPVISTDIPEVRAIGGCAVARDPDDFVRCIESALSSGGPRIERSDTMRSESWASRLDQLRLAVEGLSPRRRRQSTRRAGRPPTRSAHATNSARSS